MYLKFEEVYNQYLIYIENRLKKQTVEDIKEKFQSKILPYFKNKNFYDIKEIDYMKWQNEIEKSNYSNNYKRNLHYVFSGFVNYCVLYHNLQNNFVKKVGMFKMENKKTKFDFYTLKEFKKFIKCVDNNVYKQFFNLMYFTGTRPGEAMALKFSDISKYQISITKTISEHSINGSRLIDTPKNITSFRDITIDKKMYNQLIRLLKFYQNQNNDCKYDYFVFGGLKPLAPTSINRIKKRASEKANLRQITIHQFRHSHATLLYKYNIPLKAIKDRLGHSNINTTTSVYVHLDNKQKKKVQQKLSLIRLFF